MVTVSGNSTVLCFQTKIMLEKQKNLIQTFHSNQHFFPNSPQLKLELLKYEIRKFTVNYSENLQKNGKKIKYC